MGVRGGAGAGESSFASTLAAAQAGASWATTAIWAQYSPAVFGFLRARGSAEPEDLTSEVFLTLFSTLRSFTGGEPEFRSYLFSLAYRRLVDELRRRSRRGVHDEFRPELDPRRTESPERDAESRLADRDTLALLDSLPDDQRNVMVLRIIADLTIEQIAEVLGKRPGAIKALQRRALERLRKQLGLPRTPDEPSNDSE